MPVKVKPLFHSWALSPELTREAPEVLSKVTPEANLSRPVPKAEALPMLTVPALRLRPPEPMPVPLRVSTPEPDLVTRAVNVVSPSIVSAEPLAPVPTTVQVWRELAVRGAEIVTDPALSSTVMPALGLPEEMVRLPPEPGAMAKAVTPVGVEVKVRLFAVRGASSNVVKVVPVVLLALKIRLSVSAGTTLAGGVPAGLSAQLLARPQEAPVAPRK